MSRHPRRARPAGRTCLEQRYRRARSIVGDELVVEDLGERSRPRVFPVSPLVRSGGRASSGSSGTSEPSWRPSIASLMAFNAPMPITEARRLPVSARAGASRCDDDASSGPRRSAATSARRDGRRHCSRTSSTNTGSNAAGEAGRRGGARRPAPGGSRRPPFRRFARPRIGRDKTLVRRPRIGRAKTLISAFGGRLGSRSRQNSRR